MRMIVFLPLMFPISMIQSATVIAWVERNISSGMTKLSQQLLSPCLYVPIQKVGILKNGVKMALSVKMLLSVVEHFKKRAEHNLPGVLFSTPVEQI